MVKEHVSAEVIRGKGADVEKPWYEKWLELFAKLISAKGLEKAVVDLAGARKPDISTKLSVVIGRLKGEDGEIKRESKDFLSKLVEKFLAGDIEEAKKLVESKFVDLADKEVVDHFKQVKGDEGEDEARVYIDAVASIEKRQSMSVAEAEVVINTKTKRVIGETDQIKQLRAEIDKTRQRGIDKSEREKKIEEAFMKKKKDLVVERTTEPNVKRKLEIKGRERKLELVKRVVDQHLKGNQAIEMKRGDVEALWEWREGLGGAEREMADQLIDEIVSTLDSEDQEKFLGWVPLNTEDPNLSMAKKSLGRELKPQEKAVLERLAPYLGADLSEENLQELLAGGRGGYDNLSRRMGLNLNPEMLDKISVEIERELGIKDALKDNLEYGIKQVNPRLSKDDQERINQYFQRELLETIRFMIDESVDLRSAQFEPRATRYLTLMSVMGLDTSMKSIINDRFQFEYFSFVFRNNYITKETVESYQKFAAKVGAEYNVYAKALRAKERWAIETEDGDEVKLGEFTLFDLDRVASAKIDERLDSEDFKYYGIDKGEGRTYASMMLGSNLPEEIKRNRLPVMRKILKYKHGEEGYKKLLRSYGVGKKKRGGKEGEKITEQDFLDTVGNKYWDYFNGVYVYWFMTQKLGDVVGNASPKAGKKQIPKGLPEFYMKRIPTMWSEYVGYYNTTKVPEIFEALTTMGVSSMGAMRGKEVFSYLINLEMDDTDKIPGIVEGWFGGNYSDKNKRRAIKIQQSFIKSMYLQQRYHLSPETAELMKEAPYFQDLPVKMKDGNIVFDQTAQRRDTATTKAKLLEEIEQWDQDDTDFFNNIDWSFIKTKFKHDDALMKIINNPELSNKDKCRFFATNFSDDYMIFENLIAKRGDDPLKYNFEYYDNFAKVAGDLGKKPTWAKTIELLGVVQSIIGTDKVGPIRDRLVAIVKALRAERDFGERVVRYDKVHGAMQWDKDSYVGDLPGHRTLPKLKVEKITLRDKREGQGKASWLSKYNLDGEVDEDGEFVSILKQLSAAHLYTDEEYEHARKEISREELRWDSHKFQPLELWRYLSGKKLINYIAINWFNMPPHMFVDWVFENMGKTFGPFWKYLNG